MTERAITYARVSTEDQAQHGYSLESQLEACRAYAEGHGWTIIAEVSDGGVSGASLDRPGLDRIREMAEAGQFGVLVVYDLDRLARKSVYQMLIEEEFARFGVSIRYVVGDYRDDDEGRLHKQIRAAIAEYERAKFRERTNRGKRSKARRGLIVSSNRVTYGYRNDGAGHLVIAEEEAQVVRQAFRWFADEGCSIREVARRLTAEGHRPRLGGAGWAKSSVAMLLQNETYVGVAYYNKTGRASAHGGLPRPRPREEWIAIPVPAIVDRELWERAQRRMAHNRKRVRGQRRHTYLLSGMLVCGACGYAYGGDYAKGRRYYRDGGRAHPSLAADRIEQAVWEEVRALLLDPSRLREGHEGRSAAEGERERVLRERQSILEARAARLDERMAALHDAYLDPEIAISKSEYLRRRHAIEREARELAVLREAVAKELNQERISEEALESLEAFASRVREGIERINEAEKRKVLETLQIQGTVHTGADGAVWVDVEGLLVPPGTGVSARSSVRSARLPPLPPGRA